MKKYKLNSRNGLCNFFAEYISTELSQEGKYDTVISVTDCESLIIIKGYTENETIQDIKEIINKFISQHSVEFSFVDLEKISTIDMVSFGEKNKFKNKKLKWRFEKYVHFPNYTVNEVNTPVINSEFPYGFSKNYLKNLYLYLEHISYNIQDYFGYNFIEFEVEQSENGNVEIVNILTDSVYSSSKLHSIILDNFEMNVSEIDELISSHDFVRDMLYSINSSPWYMIKENSEFRVI
jgi:hypothetical protein